MDFSFTKPQTDLRDAVIRFARRELADDAVARERWKQCGAFGMLGLPFPVAYGGKGMDVVSALLALEAFGYACQDNALGFALGAQMWGVQTPIYEFGTDEQKHRFLTPLCGGEWVGAHAVNETDSDSHATKLFAARDGDHDVLNGSKVFVPHAPLADVFLAFATLGETGGTTGFVVERDTPGLRVSDEARPDRMTHVIFEDCRVPVANRLGRDGQGDAILRSAGEWERGCVFAPCVGAMQRRLEACVQFARAHEQFGQPIGKSQSIANRLVDMRMRWETSRSLLYQAAWNRQHNGTAPLESGVAKLHIGESWVKNCLDAGQVCGGFDGTVEPDLERDLRDAVAATLYAGASDAQRNLIAEHLGL